MKAAPFIFFAIPGMVLVLTLGFIIFPGSKSPAFKCADKDQMASVTPTSGAWTIPIGSAYKVTSAFGGRRDPISGATSGHGGQDLSSSSGRAPILAAGSGKVIVADKGGSATTWGKYVKIDHGGGLATLYAHLSEVRVSQGDAVTTGQRIGTAAGPESTPSQASRPKASPSTASPAAKSRRARPSP